VRKFVLILAGGGLVVLAAVGLIAYPRMKQQWETPLGPGLDLPTRTAAVPTFTQTRPPEPTSLPEENEETALPVATEKTVFQPSQTPAFTATPAPLCGGPPVATVLGIGADSGIDYRYGLADVMRIVRIDYVTPKVSVLSIPRDLWVEIPGIEDHNITHGKLNQAYFYGGKGMGYYDGPGEGPGLLARTLDRNFGLAVDHYGAVNMQTFVNIIDAVGGVDLYLPKDVDGRPIDDRTIDLGYFNAGNQHLSGEAALRLARIRKRYNDFTRMDHQNMVLCALKEKLLTPSVLPKIPKIISSFQGQVLTDLSPEQIGQMACLLPHLKKENLLFTSLPDELFSPGRALNKQMGRTTFVLEADYSVLQDYMARFIAGEWPSEPSAEMSCP
jgi:LCP family protein required for cell wall assembly